jgi:hypothetical protein
MDTWRCPTCFAVLSQSGAKRCPQCHSRLRKRRSKPIVLGETSRLDRQAALIVDRQNMLRSERVFVADETPRAAASVAAPHVDLTRPEPMTIPEAILEDVHEPVLLAIVEKVVVAEPEPEPVVEAVVVAPEQEIVEPEGEAEPVPSFLELALAGHAVAPPPLADDDLDTDIDSIEGEEAEDEPVPSFLDLALAEQMVAPRPADSVDLDAAIQGDDVNSIVEALHRKARGERRAFPDVQLFESAPPEPEATARPLRLMAPASSSRRRWSIELKNRRAGDNL